ncbi:hypothetical protein SLS53_004736 [Cytospora paraplurivora]|uniref:Malic acid transport protein n=1 Tax=Cytospora paraplurivora TaxID=2898453 RepID=A0AAN9YG63_9PEZI
MEGPIQHFGEHNHRLEYDSRLDLDSSAVEVPQEIHADYQISRRFSTDSPNVHGESTESTRVSTPNNEYDVEKQHHDTRQLKGDTHMEQNTHDINAPRVPLRERLHHFTWAWWTLIMSTGGLSLLIFVQPYQFPGLKHFGLAVYLLTLALFVVVFSAMVARFIMFPGTLKTSICHAREGLFFPTFFLSIATLITATYRYAIPADNVTFNFVIRVAFWVYVSCTLVLAIGQYSYLFHAHKLEVRSMMPTWILPIFPIMLSGTIASVIAESQPDSTAVAIVYSGLACQGLGISVSFLMYAHMVGRLMQYGLPNREHRPGLFMNVGPPAFTCLAFIGMANGLPDEFDSNGVMDIHFIRQMAVLGGVYLWGLSLWWLGVAIVAVLSSPPKHFHLGWWAAVFPNTGFTLATITLGNAIGSKVITKLPCATPLPDG